MSKKSVKPERYYVFWRQDGMDDWALGLDDADGKDKEAAETCIKQILAEDETNEVMVVQGREVLPVTSMRRVVSEVKLP